MPSRAPSRWGPRWSRWVGRFLARIYWNTEVKGLDEVPPHGPVVVVANHIGFIDGPLVHGVLRRGSHFLITDTMFKGPLKLILGAAAQIRVRGSGRDALVAGKAVLERGDIVGVFPEGTRGAGTADAVQGGAAWLALHTGASIVPVAILGTRRAGESVNVWPRPRRTILLHFGPRFRLDVPDGMVARARQEWAQRQVALRLREHVHAVEARSTIKLPGPPGSMKEAHP